MSTSLGIFNAKDANGEVLFDLFSAIAGPIKKDSIFLSALIKENKIIPWELFLL